MARRILKRAQPDVVDPLDLFPKQSEDASGVRPVVNESRDEQAARMQAADEIGEWVKKKDRKASVSAQSKRNAAREVEGMVISNDWSGAAGRHFVALYALSHLRVYGVEAAELEGRDSMLAVAMANRMLARNFDGDGAAMAAFVRWTWTRERRHEQWRRENGRSGRRMHWRLQFSGALLSDFRVDLARRAKV